MARVYQRRKILYIQCMGQVEKFCIDEIIYFEHTQRKLLLHTLKGKYCFPYISILRVKEILEGDGFVQCHQSYLVNSSYISRVRCGHNVVELVENAYRVSIGRRYKQGFLREIQYIT